jgi:hypothetical protein
MEVFWLMLMLNSYGHAVLFIFNKMYYHDELQVGAMCYEVSEKLANDI